MRSPPIVSIPHKRTHKMEAHLSSSLASLSSSFKNLQEFPEELGKKATLEVLKPSGLTIPQLNYTPKGVVASIRVGKKATIVKITLKEPYTFDGTLCCLNPHNGYAISDLFKRQTGLTIATVFGDAFWEDYQNAIVKEPSLPPNPEKVIKMLYACIAGDVLYWRMSAQVYMDAMEDETNEAMSLVLAKKAQIAFQQSEMTLGFLKASMPCDITVSNI